ncbi:MAG: M56 family metallopeptidase [Caulobacteraceae bacterium]
MFAILLALPLAAFLPTLAVITLPAAPLATVPAATVETVEPAFGGAVSAIALALTAWGLGALVDRGPRLAGMCWLERLCFRSAPLPPARLPLPLPRGCRVRLSPDRMGPMTWGAVRPVILLPDDALDWPRERLEAALRHELAHMARKDSLIQALALLACALYWPNPLVWRAAAALRREAETAADDAVIAAGVRPSDYAGLLVELAGEWPSRRQVSFEMAMAAPPILTERVQSILSPDAMRTGATAMDTFKLALMGGAALAALALARPSVAETPAPAAGPTFTATPAGPILTPAPAAQPAQHVESEAHGRRPGRAETRQASGHSGEPGAARPCGCSGRSGRSGRQRWGVDGVPDGDHAKPRANVFYRDFGDQDGKLTPEQRAELNRHWR